MVLVIIPLFTESLINTFYNANCLNKRSFENATFIAFGGDHNSLVVIMLHLTCIC